MGILDGIVDWLATQVMNLLDLASTSVLGALDCNMDTFKRYFPAASAMYEIFIWTAIGLVLLNLVWQLYRCYGAGFDIDTENPTNLVVRSVIFLLLIWYCDDIVNLALQIGGTPYNWILDSNLPGVQFGDFNSVLLVIIGVIANGSVALIALILVMVLAWNYLKLLLEAAERLETYQKKGYDTDWIHQRLLSIRVCNELTAEWQERGVQQGKEYITQKETADQGPP